MLWLVRAEEVGAGEVEAGGVVVGKMVGVLVLVGTLMQCHLKQLSERPDTLPPLLDS